jgi:hypothetical protein
VGYSDCLVDRAWRIMIYHKKQQTVLTFANAYGQAV